MEDPGLAGAVFQAKHIIDGAHAVENQWQGEALAELDLCLEGCELQGIGRGAQAVEAAFADEAGW